MCEGKSFFFYVGPHKVFQNQSQEWLFFYSVVANLPNSSVGIEILTKKKKKKPHHSLTFKIHLHSAVFSNAAPVHTLPFFFLPEVF